MPTPLAELSAPNAEAARGFYGAVLGCSLEERTLSEQRPGFACVRDGQDVALIFQAPQVVVNDGGDAVWDPEPRFAVADLDEAVNRALALGAELLAPAAEGQALLRDPQAATFRLAG